MKKTLLIAILTLSITMVFSQSGFSVYTSDMVIKMDDPSRPEYVSQGYIVNRSDQTIRLRWEKVIESLPNGATVAINDHVTQRDPLLRQNDFFIKGADTAYFDLHYYPNGHTGNATIRVLVQDVNGPSERSDLTYTVKDISGPSSTRNIQEDIRVFPNPASDYFSVNGLDQLKEVIVINLVGQEVKRFSASIRSKYDVSDLARGLYLVRLVGNQEKVIKTVRLSKR